MGVCPGGVQGYKLKHITLNKVRYLMGWYYGFAIRAVILWGGSLFIPCTVPCGNMLGPTILCLRLCA